MEDLRVWLTRAEADSLLEAADSVRMQHLARNQRERLFDGLAHLESAETKLRRALRKGERW